MKYTQGWTEFEIQSLAFSLMRKHLYPAFLIRGDYQLEGCRAPIAVFKANKGQGPTLKLIVEVKQPDDAVPSGNLKSYAETLGVQYVLIAGLKEAYKAVEKVQEHLFK